ncbi:MAG: YMGG-like glycine zipper-containing protein [Gemmatimonadaceae bacterium]
MRTLGITLSLAALAAVGACGRGNDARPDDALKNDLALAAQAQPYQAQQFVSPAEQQYAANGQPLPYNAGVTRAPTMRAPAPVYRAPARRSASSRSSGGYSYPAPAPRPVVKHTGRDAAIGAGAGAIIGAAASRDKLKGGLIGAAAGGILGAVIGNNVDVQRP